MPNIETTSNPEFSAKELAISEEAREKVTKAGQALQILNTHENTHENKHETDLDR